MKYLDEISRKTLTGVAPVQEALSNPLLCRPAQNHLAEDLLIQRLNLLLDLADSS